VISTESWVRDELGLLSWGFLKANGEVWDDDGSLYWVCAAIFEFERSCTVWSGAFSVHD
jgi:hypothetical protein